MDKSRKGQSFSQARKGAGFGKGKKYDFTDQKHLRYIPGPGNYNSNVGNFSKIYELKEDLSRH